MSVGLTYFLFLSLSIGGLITLLIRLIMDGPTSSYHRFYKATGNSQ